jgi:hypothetical protein
MSNISHVRVVVNLVEVEEVTQTIGRFGDHYLNRVFTAHDIASFGDPGGVVVALGRERAGPAHQSGSYLSAHQLERPH